jgi:predicted secreted protein
VKPRAKLALSIAAVILAAAVLAAAIAYYRVAIYDFIPTPPIVVTEKDHRSNVTLQRGQRLAVQLRGNSLSGSTWRSNMPLSFLPEQTASFQPDQSPKNAGDGVQTTTFKAVDVGQGPLFLNYTDNENQNSLQPGRTFSIVVTVQ